MAHEITRLGVVGEEVCFSGASRQNVVNVDVISHISRNLAVKLRLSIAPGIKGELEELNGTTAKQYI